MAGYKGSMYNVIQEPRSSGIADCNKRGLRNHIVIRTLRGKQLNVADEKKPWKERPLEKKRETLKTLTLLVHG